MRTQEQDPTGTRTIQGQINSDGSIAFGTGFSVVKTGTGTYTIRPTPSLRATKTAVATPNTAGMAVLNFGGGAYTGFINVATLSTAGAAADMSFQFIFTGIAR